MNNSTRQLLLRHFMVLFVTLIILLSVLLISLLKIDYGTANVQLPSTEEKVLIKKITNGYNSNRDLYGKRTKQGKGWRSQWKKGGKKKIESIFNCPGAPDFSRWRHEVPLYKGQFLCSVKNYYVFGLTDDGELIWADIKRAKVHEFFEIPDHHRGLFVNHFYNESLEHFRLTVDAHIQVVDGLGNVIYDLKPKLDGIERTNCLIEEGYECPYLHLHRDGVNVLNYRDPDDYYYWDEWDVRRAYRYDKRTKVRVKSLEEYQKRFNTTLTPTTTAKMMALPSAATTTAASAAASSSATKTVIIAAAAATILQLAV